MARNNGKAPPQCGHNRRWRVGKQGEVADALDVPAGEISANHRKGVGMAPRWPRGGGLFEYCIPCEAIELRRRQGPATIPGVGSEDAALLSGGDSPNLERMRAARAGIWELELATKRLESVPIDAANVVLERFIGHAEQFKGAAFSRFGPEGEQLADEMLQNMRRVLDDFCVGGSNGNGNGGR